MRVIAAREYSAYDAFIKGGFDDGDDELVEIFFQTIAQKLEAAGWEIERVSNVHNHWIGALLQRGFDGTIRKSIDPVDVLADLTGEEPGDGEVRQALIDQGVPAEVIKALDELDAKPDPDDQMSPENIARLKEWLSITGHIMASFTTRYIEQLEAQNLLS